MRKRLNRDGIDFDSLPKGKQVQYIIDNWDKIWTPVNAITVDGMSTDDCEYLDIVIIEPTIEEVRGTEYEKYIPEIIQGYRSFEFI